MPNSRSNDSTRTVMVVGGLVLVTGFLYWAKPVLIPLAMAILLAFILTPAVNLLQKRGLGRIPSVLVVVLLAGGLVGGIGWVVGHQVSVLLGNLPHYKENIVSKVQALRGDGQSGFWTQVQESINQIISDASGAVPDAEAATAPVDEDPNPTLGASPKKPMYVLMTASNYSRLSEFAGPAAEGLATTFLVVIMVIFMLVQRESLRNRVVRLIGHGQIIATTRAIDEGARRISGYLLMQLYVNAAFGFLLGIGLVLLSFCAETRADAETLRRYALLWGLVSGTFKFVPYVGTWLAAALLLAFSVATVHGWLVPLAAFGIFMVLELVSANVIEPLVFGHSTGSQPLALLLAAAFWTWLWGPAGLLLSTPMTVVMVVIGKYVPQLHFLEVMLGDEPVLEPQTVLYQRMVARDQDEATELVEDYVKEHGLEKSYEDLLLPSLSLARQDSEREELEEHDFRDLYMTATAIIDDMDPLENADLISGGTILGCPARDEVDELALVMFAKLLRAQGRKIEVISSHLLLSEMIEKIESMKPAVVLVSSLPPGGVAQTRYLCKRIKSQFPNIKVVVGRWGQKDKLDKMHTWLKAAGADVIGTTLPEVRAEVISLLQVGEAAASKARKPTAEKVGAK